MASRETLYPRRLASRHCQTVGKGESQVSKLHRYAVRYIERDGHIDKTVVWADSKGEARRTASRHGCEDILKVRRVRSSWTTVIVIALVLAGILYVAVR